MPFKISFKPVLIQFSVKNYRSIKDEVELQLITDSGQELLDSNTFALNANGAHNLRLMKSAVIYGANAAKKCPILLRRIRYHDAVTGKEYEFLTNNFKLAARTIADIYKARWQVELFFKWIKQNLKIKSFIGTSNNAVMTQIWIALCVYLLLSFVRFQSKHRRSLQQMLRLLLY